MYADNKHPQAPALSARESWRLNLARAVLMRSGIIVHATEAVMGVAASASDRAACERVSALKGRHAAKHFIVICQSLAQISELADINTPYYADILASWPGPTTWIVPAQEKTPAWLINSAGAIAVRLTAHAQAAALCQRAGPLISTSANLGGSPPARRLFTARRYFGQRVDFYLAGQLGRQARPSRLIDGLTGIVIRA